MAERMKNIAGLFKEGRTRVIVLTTLVILFIAIIVGIASIRGRVSGEAGEAGVTSAPGNIQSVPFSAPSKYYAGLQEQQNTQQAKQAEASGGSAIPTIVNAENSANIKPPPNAQPGVGFTALSRQEEEGASFNPKVFGEDQAKTCAMPNAVTPVFDSEGRLIGYADKDGKVRGLNGEVIGTLGADGAVHDSCGTEIGRVQVPQAAGAAATPVYDSNGRLIGTVGPDGKVRDANGNLVGTVDPDGTVRDVDGNVIGHAGSYVPGTPVYDSNGKLLGYVGADGKVRDANGNVIGTVGPDGSVRDASGKIIGQVGTPVYDATGKLIGFAGPDGKVRDANGNIIGTVGPDGVVRDVNGRIIGKAGAISPGTPVYGPDGRIIGYVGPDGKVRDVNGNVIGTIGVDGQVRDVNGNIIGSVSQPTSAPTSPKPTGTPIYDANGNIIGYVGADGKVRDANGNILGTVGADGQVRDVNGNVIGGTVAPTASAPVAQTPEQLRAAALARQQAILQNQQLSQELSTRQSAMAQQASQLISAWTSPTQVMVSGAGETDEASGGQGQGGAGGAGGQQGSGGALSGPVFIKAGTVYYGTINTSINSDEPVPVLGTITNGPYKGGRIIGTLSNQGQAVLLAFNTLTLPNYPQSIAINAVAIDQNTARTALSTYTDNHYLMRYGALFGSSFIQGYGQAFSTSGSSTSTNGLTTTSSTPDLTPAGKFFVALGNVGTALSAQMNTIFNTPPTVYVAAGTSVGILFLGDVQLPDQGGTSPIPPAMPGQPTASGTSMSSVSSSTTSASSGGPPGMPH